MIIEVTKSIQKHTESIKDLNKIVCFSDKRKVQNKAKELIAQHKQELNKSLQKLKIISR